MRVVLWAVAEALERCHRCFLLRFLLCPLLLVEEALLPIAAGLARVQAKDDKTSKKPAKKVARRTERLIAACVRRP